MSQRDTLISWMILIAVLLTFWRVNLNSSVLNQLLSDANVGPSRTGPFLIPSRMRPDEYISRKYDKQVSDRVEVLRLCRTVKKDLGFMKLYNAMVPEVFCPNLVRIGEVNDGGKWVCHPRAMPDNCAIFSLGVSQDTSFEREMQEITSQKCSVYSYDKGQPQPSVLEDYSKIRAQFTKALIANSTNLEKGERSIGYEMERLGLKRIEILKIDIEGAEFLVMPTLIKQAKMCQILIEIHGDPKFVVNLVVMLAQAGYRLFSYEINGMYHSLSEYSFIHDDCLETYGASPLAYYWHLV
ncbi:unnamed protein product, partial [Mesorhabditis spiculigera]